MNTRALITFFSLILLLSCNGKNGTDINNKSIVTHKSNESPNQEVLAEKGDKLMEEESIGEIKLGLKQEKINEIYGRPNNISELVFSDVDGETYENVEYKTLGISISYLLMNDSSREVSTIEIKEPCKLKTLKSIGIGSSIEEVKESYKELINPVGSGPETIVVGSIYGGLVFNFKGNKVSRIYIGPSAE